jgi:zinc protease
MLLRHSIRTAILLASALGISGKMARADDLPRAETILDQYIEATGGKAAYEKVKNRVIKGIVEVSGQDAKGTTIQYQAEPNKMTTEIDYQGIGKAHEGTDGTVAWETLEKAGDRVLSGEEKEIRLLQATFNEHLNWKKIYTKAETTSIEDVQGKPAYKVVLTPKVGKPVTTYFDKASHLVVKQVRTEKSRNGEATLEIYPSDYKKVDGILIPHKGTHKMKTHEIVVTITEIKQNVSLPPDAFKVPDAVKELIKKID